MRPYMLDGKTGTAFGLVASCSKTASTIEENFFVIRTKLFIARKNERNLIQAIEQRSYIIHDTHTHKNK